MKLFTELVEDVQYIVEEKNGKKDLYITGIYMQAETKNGNGRIYKLPILEREVARYNKQYVETNRALGEIGHPSGPSINLDRVSHKIVELRQDGNNFIGKAKVLSTPMGNIARGIMEAGGKLGVSTRGLGTLEETSKGYKLVKDDFFLSTAADIVADPSAPDAFVSGIMEGKEWVWEGGILRERLAESTKRRINTLVDERTLQEHKVQLFQDFLGNL